MILKQLNYELSVVQIQATEHIDLTITPIFIGKTNDEISVVLPTKLINFTTVKREDKWRALKIDEVLDFSLVGIIAKIATLLAENSISIFALSTFNTDYILIKEEMFSRSKKILSDNGYFLT